MMHVSHVMGDVSPAHSEVRSPPLLNIIASRAMNR
jgi:hypothetical protein